MIRILAILACFTVSFASPAFSADAAKPESPSSKPASKKISLAEFDKARQEKGVIVLDVRSPEEFNGGHVPGAMTIPISGKGAEDFDARVKELPKDKPILVYCRSGVRSAKAVAKMQTLGFEHLADFSGGWIAWKEADKPVEQAGKITQGGEKK